MDIVEDCEYAWFVASGSVTAEGMTVKAQSEGNLVIRHTTERWATVASAGMDEASPLKPASTADLASWVHASAANPGNYSSDGEWDNITTTVNPNSDDGNNSNGFVAVKQFFIRAATSDEANRPRGLYVESINITGNPIQGMSSSLRVGIRCTYGDEGGSFIYAPITTVDNPAQYGIISAEGVAPVVRGVHLADGSTQAVTLSTTGTGSPLLDDSVSLPLATADPNTASSATNAVEVMVYIWFEGEDENLYSDNYATEDIDISINFSSLAVGPASA